MTMRRMIGGYATAAFLAAALAVLGPPVAAQDADISGVVTSAAGPEAGVWVIAETEDFDTGFRKIVVTDDDGRFLVPDLPDAAYEVWVRGYGLADSDKTAARPGDEIALTAIAAASPHEAAEIYPANYWYSLLEVPPASDFPGTGPRGNGIGVAMRTQADWVDRLKDGCQLCHQLGNKATREMPMLDLDDFDSAVDAWEYRIRAGGAGPAMAVEINRMGRPRALQLYADWSDLGSPPASCRRRRRARRVARAQPRPQHVEVGSSPRHGPRRDHDRQAQPDAQRERADLRGRRGGARDHRSAHPHVGPHGPADPHRASAAQRLVPGLVHRDSIALLGQRAGQPAEPERPQPDAGRQGAPVDHPGGAAERRAPTGAWRARITRSRSTTTRFSTAPSPGSCPTTTRKPAGSS